MLLMTNDANLDAFWSRARSTVDQNTQRIRQTLKILKILGLDGIYEHTCPYPVFDHYGYEVALTKLIHSHSSSKHNKSYIHIPTIRYSRETFGSCVRASPYSNIHHYSIVDQRGKYVMLPKDKCGSIRYSRFMVYLKILLGSIWKPNQGVPQRVFITVIETVEEMLVEIKETT